MKAIVGLSMLFLALQASAGDRLICTEMDQAADSIAQINGASFASPTYRIAPMPTMTENGAEFEYLFDAIQVTDNLETPQQIVGRIKVNALIKKDETKCKILALTFKSLN